MIFTNANIFYICKKCENQCILLDNFLMDFNMFWNVFSFFAVVCDDLLVIRMLDRNMSINMLLILCIPDGIADCT